MTFRFPGFRDGHAHPLFAGRELLGPVLTGCSSIEEIQQVLRQFRADNPRLTWIDCGSYNRNLAPAGRFDASWLDAAVADIPVVVHADDHHTCWVNSAALRVAGLDREVPELSAGSIDIDDLGRATGVLREWEAMNLVYVHQPKLSLDDEVLALERAQFELLRGGVVGVLDAWIDPGMEQIYLAAEERGKLVLRTNLAPRLSPATWQTDLDFATRTRAAVDRNASPRLACKTIKVFADGVFGSGTAAMLEPYESTAVEPAGLGEPLWSEAELTQAVTSADLSGFQVHIHAIGDGGVRMALNAIEAMIHANPTRDRRPVLAHVELIATADLVRLRELGVGVNLQPLWARPDDMLTSCTPRLGPTRVDQLYRFRDLLEAGVNVGFGSDWPVSSPVAFEGIYTAVNRCLPGAAQAHSPNQALTLDQAMRAYSIGSAWQLFQEQHQGSDWVELSADPTSLPAEQWHQIRTIRAQIADRLIEL